MQTLMNATVAEMVAADHVCKPVLTFLALTLAPVFLDTTYTLTTTHAMARMHHYYIS
jgi:hypothetical protein